VLLFEDKTTKNAPVRGVGKDENTGRRSAQMPEI
jgi:hypothetical protein